MIASDIAAFYTSALGQAVKKTLAGHLEKILPSHPQQRVLGLGYASPYLSQHEHGLSFMLARGGVVHWPDGQANRTCLVDELNLPLADHSIDAVLIVHGAEFCENAEDMLHDVWRSLAPQGRLILIVPSRRGLWARSEASPFGRGQPFSRRQIFGLMRAAQFELNSIRPALICPPWFGAVGLQKLELAAPLGFGGGVLIAHATKMVHGFLPKRLKLRALPRLRPALAGMRATG